MHCTSCHRPLRLPSPDGLGPVCRRRAQIVPPVGRDLFGYDVAAATEAAHRAVQTCIEAAALEAMFATRAAFRAARVRMEVLA